MPTNITERPSTGTVWNHRGREAVRIFDVVAASLDDAKNLLATTAPFLVTENVPYKNPQGVIPDPACLCLQINGSARVEAPTTGGSGLYELYAQYGYRDFRGRIVALPPANGVRNEYLRISPLTVTTDRDLTGQPIQTKGGQVFEPSPTKIIPLLTLEWEWQKTGSNQIALANLYGPYLGKVNSVSFRGYAPRCVLCSNLKVDPIAGGGFEIAAPSLFRIYMEFTFNPPKVLRSNGANVTYPGHDVTLLHRGTMGWDQASGEYFNLHEGDDPTKPLVRAPVNLAPAGTRQATPGLENYISFQIYDVIDFTQIPL